LIKSPVDRAERPGRNERIPIGVPLKRIRSTRAGIAPAPEYDISTLAGKVASLNGTAGLQVRFSACVEHEATGETSVAAPAPITPTNVLTSSLYGTSVTAPAVTVDQDVSAAPQNETAIALDPNNPERVVGSANDYVARTRSTRAAGSEAGSSATTPICRSNSTEGSTRCGLTPTTSSQPVGSTAPSSCQRSSTNRTRPPQQASSHSRRGHTGNTPPAMVRPLCWRLSRQQDLQSRTEHGLLLWRTERMQGGPRPLCSSRPAGLIPRNTDHPNQAFAAPSAHPNAGALVVNESNLPTRPSQYGFGNITKKDRPRFSAVKATAGSDRHA